MKKLERKNKKSERKEDTKSERKKKKLKRKEDTKSERKEDTKSERKKDTKSERKKDKKDVSVKMKKEDVDNILAIMSKGAIAIRQGITNLKLGRAHEDYGFNSFKEFIVAVVVPEIGYSYDSCNDQANAGEIEYNVGGKEFIGVNSYSSLEPLIRARLEPADQKEVFQHIKDGGGFDSLLDIPKKYISRKNMEDALIELGYDTQSNKSVEKDIAISKEANSLDKDDSLDASNAPEPINESTSNDHITDFCNTFIDWAGLNAAVDKDEIYDFFECMNNKADGQDDFELLVIDVVKNTLSLVSQKKLYRKLKLSIAKISKL